VLHCMTRKILLVEDNPDDISLIRKALAKSGFAHDLTVLNDGKEASDYLLQQGPYHSLKSKDRPDLVILDLHLPLMSGFEVLENLKNNGPSRITPVVVLTVSNDENDVLRCYELGASSCIRKRTQLAEFEESIKDMMAYWFTFAKLPPRD
jgi:two-component system, response regulator